ncbi:formate dehydrogenase accessory sulfurtransferase FdhD [Amycolatopsis sp. cmx-4-54]|uniref:formate dehydrogenase accessory sulfurtransferase FdhD n=1 Tax=Amycolatopsis sp. cmx-4-54 TaxID=2790936 RepID=UPI00397DCDE5
MGRVTVRRPVRMISATKDVRRPDALAAEEPLEIRVGGKALAVTMRTPGNDVELAHGFLLSEGVLTSREDIAVARYCDGVDDQGRNTYNVLDIALAEGVAPPETGVERNFYTTSSCGVCGKAALDAVKLKSRFSPEKSEFTVSTDVLSKLPDTLRAHQKVFSSTGGLHAAALFDGDGTVAVVREDVGRHNAVDKVLGWALQEGRIPAADVGLLVSGRASFELVQKAAMAGIGLLAAVSAPSSLAAELADENGMTLIGFLRGDSMNLYSGEQRVLGLD